MLGCFDGAFPNRCIELLGQIRNNSHIPLLIKMGHALFKCSLNAVALSA